MRRKTSLHRIARGHIPLVNPELDEFDSEGNEGFLRVGPVLKAHNPYSNAHANDPHRWLTINVLDAHIDPKYRVERAPAYWQSWKPPTGETPLKFSGTVEILGDTYETYGIHFRSGHLAGSIVLPTVFTEYLGIRTV